MTAGALLLAFAAGLLSFATPCVLPLVPGYLAAIGAVEAEQLSGGQRLALGRVLRASLPFVLGFTVIFVLLGAAAGSVGDALEAWRPDLVRAAGIIVVAMGFALAGVLPLPFVGSSAVTRARERRSALLLGAAFAICFTPCVGPVLLSILALASSQGSPPRAAVLLGSYSLGLALPFLAVAVAFGRTLETFRWVRDRYDAVKLVAGGMLVVFGLLVFFDRLWLLNLYVDRGLRAVGLDGLPAL